MSFPSVLLCIVLAAVLGAGLHTVVIAIIVIDWTRFCRVVRAETMVQKSHDYVASAVTIGLEPGRILASEILPNVAPLLLTLFTLEMGIAIVVEAILSFVGLSVSSGMPTWGGIIQEGRLYVNQAWWLMALPMACIIVAVLGLNALGDGLREVLDPVRMRWAHCSIFAISTFGCARGLPSASSGGCPCRSHLDKSSGWSANPARAKPWSAASCSALRPPMPV